MYVKSEGIAKSVCGSSFVTFAFFRLAESINDDPKYLIIVEEFFTVVTKLFAEL